MKSKQTQSLGGAALYRCDKTFVLSLGFTVRRKIQFLGGAAVHRCDKTSILSWASVPEVRAADFFNKLMAVC
jgi:hypothetical protein